MPQRRGREPRQTEVARGLVAGDASVAKGENFRHEFGTYEEAADYLEDIGIDLDAMGAIYAITAMPITADRWPARRGWDNLAPSTRKRYEGSRQAQEEAEAHGVSLQQWYEVAPDTKAFGGHATGRDVELAPIGFYVYLSRDSDLLAADLRAELQAQVVASPRVQDALAMRGQTGDTLLGVGDSLLGLGNLLLGQPLTDEEF